MKKKKETERFEEEFIRIADHYCYICHKRFFLICGTPQVKIGGCCYGLDYKGVRNILSLYAHLPCYMSKEVKRKHSIIPEIVFKRMVKDYCQLEIKGIKSYLGEVAEYKWDVDTNEDKERLAKLERWLKEVTS
jgi:hypothetical protein